MKQLIKYSDYLICILIFIIYQFTLAPSVVQIDSGELAAIQATFGIAHPSGYPLFTILGYLFSLIPLPISKILALNILTSIYVTAAAFFIIRTIKSLILNFEIFQTEKKSNKKKQKSENRVILFKLDNISATIIAVITGLIIPFSKTFWFQSTSVEVYSLHLLLLSLNIYFIVKILFQKEVKLTNWLIIAVLLALGFGNHLTTFLLLPGLAYVYFSKEKFSMSSIKQIGKMLLLFFPILVLLYLVLYFRALQNPEINWGNPIDFERFWRHFTGKQYLVWMFSSIDAAKSQLAYFFSNLPSEFAYVNFIIGLIGVYAGFKYAKKVSIFIAICFIFTVLYSINYNINDIDSYFLLSFISFGIFIVYGVLFLIYKLKIHLSSKANFYYTGLIILPLLQIFMHFSSVDQSKMYMYSDYTKTLLNGVDKNGVVLSYQWDYFISESYYFQKVENFRNDIKIIDKELLRRSWYYNQMEKNYPEIIKDMKAEITGFLDALKPFERSENFDPSKLEFFYQAIMRKIITDNYSNHSIYIGPEFLDNEIQKKEFVLPEGYSLVPVGLLYKVTKGSNYVPAPDMSVNIRFPETEDKYSVLIKNIVYISMTNRAMYEITFNNIDKAKKIAANIIKLFPERGLRQNLAQAML
ncbi:MAG: DUF2723 domain-containing protein [bacterium]